MRWLAAVALCAGCYRPGADPACAIACVAGVPDNCPAGLACVDGFCGGTSACSDAMIADMEIADSAISEIDAGLCVGTNMPLEVCLAGMPTADLDVTLRTTFNTTNCTSVLHHQNTDLCVYAYRNVTVSNVLQFIGTRPAVIVAVGTVEVTANGVITVAAAPPALVPGAGHDPMICSELDEGTTAVTQQGGAGGGAGGSFASAGGRGGTGDGATGAPNASAVPPPYLALRGGCTGSRGGNDSGGGGGGLPGVGGGALAILATGAFVVDGAIYAYGSGGEGATGAYAGGGGGGSGGMILIDAVSLGGGGRINASGGGGGAGGTNVVGGDSGGVVLTHNLPDTGGPGGFAGVGAGEGGQGGSTGPGSVGGASPDVGGGGGGGGGGVVLLRGAVQGSLTNVYPRR